MPSTIRLVVGDPYEDGHGKHDSYRYYINWTKETVIKGYKEGCKILGFDLHSDHCNDYEDSTIPLVEAEALVTHGVMKREEFESWCNPEGEPNPCQYHGEYCNDGASVYGSQWAELYMRIAKLGAPNLTFKESPASDEIQIGGYGFYY